MFFQVHEFPTEMNIIDFGWLCHANRPIEQNRFRRTFPTHTEDGIPIRKIYVSNLPPCTTRTELLNVFAPYGHIRSCFLYTGRNNEENSRGSNNPPFGFVTYVNPADAHKALQAPNHEKCLRGCSIRTSPADSWHQPYEDSQGNIIWNRNKVISEQQLEANTSDALRDQPENEENAEVEEYTILDLLNRDCMLHVMSFVPLKDLIRSERVSKRWRSTVRDYLQSIKSFKTSSWDHTDASLTTAVLRQLLSRLGSSLLRFHIDNYWSALNDRTAHALGRFCPVLEDLKVVGMYTKNWNPLFKGCKQLKSISFVSCNQLTDVSLIPILNPDSSIRTLYLANNTHVTGTFLTNVRPLNIESLSFSNCYNLHGTVIMAGLAHSANLKCLKLDIIPSTLLRHIPNILKQVPQLEELSLSEFRQSDYSLQDSWDDDLCEAFSLMGKLKSLSLSRNCYVHDKVLESIGKSCSELTYLDISGCCPVRSNFAITDDSFRSITNLKQLETFHISYLSSVKPSGISLIAKLPCLTKLYARGLDNINDTCLINVIKGTPHLQLLDICGCTGVTAGLTQAANDVTASRTHTLNFYVAGTNAAELEVQRSDHLWVDRQNDLSEPHLKANYKDDVYDDDSSLSISDELDPRYYIDSDDEFGEEYDDVLEAFEWALKPGFVLM